MRKVNRSAWVVIVCLFCAAGAQAQQSGAASDLTGNAGTVGSSVPRLVRFNGTLQDAAGKPLHGPVDVTFELFAEQAGGEPLWWETQTVAADAQGRYTVLLGAMRPEGLPVALFTTGKARWLEVMVEGGATMPRVLLVSVPYALKAGDAETLGGKPATAYVASDQLKDQVRSEMTQQLANPTIGLRSLEMMVSNPSSTPKAVTETNPSTFTCNSSSTCVAITQNGAGIGLYAESTPASGTLFGLYGKSNSTSGRAVTGYASATSGLTFGVRGQSDSTSGYGVYGLAAATSGTTFGVRGDVMSTDGRGVWGNASAATGGTYGVLGFVASNQGVGVMGQATAVTGATIGVRAVTQSPASTAAIFDNLGGGKLISAHTTGYVEKFSVDGSGNLTAAGGSFSTKVGIGTASPTARLHVVNVSSGTGGGNVQRRSRRRVQCVSMPSHIWSCRRVRREWLVRIRHRSRQPWRDWLVHRSGRLRCRCHRRGVGGHRSLRSGQYISHPSWDLQWECHHQRKPRRQWDRFKEWRLVQD
ncbi:MAG: hypothetical protein LAO07_21890 [Acidobacteriia bacterium]|nr:hypothetical protein [Terriglobia bacterium]